MLGVQQRIPIYVPLSFIGWGLMVAFLHRRAFRDPDEALRRMAAARANSRVVRALGGSGDPLREYEQLSRSRWMYPWVAVGYTLLVLWMLVIAITQL